MFRGVILVEDRFKDFDTKREKCWELVKKAWTQDLDNKDLNSILHKMQEKHGYKDKEISFLRDHIRLLMGLDPRGDEDFSDELEN